MRKNQGYRVAEMVARTSSTGEALTITRKGKSVTLPEHEADRLCRWLISLFQIDVGLEEAALGRMTRAMGRLADSLSHMVDERIKAAEAARTAREQAATAAVTRALAATTRPAKKRTRTDFSAVALKPWPKLKRKRKHEKQRRTRH